MIYNSNESYYVIDIKLHKFNLMDIIKETIIKKGVRIMRRNYFWGILCILIGVTYVARQILNIYFPISTLIIAFILIYWGISLITGHSGKREHHFNNRECNYHAGNEQNIIFSNCETKVNNEQDKYNLIFSSGIIDLRTLNMPLENRSLKVDVIFSKGLIRINPDIPAVIKVDSAFANARFPNNTQVSFGNYTYVTRSYKQDMPHLYIKIDVVFGSADIME